MHNPANNENKSIVGAMTGSKPTLKERIPELSRLISLALACVIGLMPISDAQANQRDQVKRMYDRLAGVPPTQNELNRIINELNDTNSPNYQNLNWAAHEAMNHPAFYNVTLKNFATPWTNEAQDVFAPLNDSSALVIGLIRDNRDYRELLYENVIYTSDNASVATYSNSNNQHYVDLETNNIDLSQMSNLSAKTQTQVTGLAVDATAGIMTTRATSRAFYVDGTNRAMFRFTVLNHLCYDMEQLKDNTRPADRIRQDVSRSPGGNSTIFFTNCLGCHAGMDPMVQAFANYEWDYKDNNPDTEDDPEIGSLLYTAGIVQPKYHINANNFKGGYFTQDSGWTNYWRRGPNAWLKWGENPPPGFGSYVSVDSKGISSGVGAKSLGMELASTDAFARCQVKKVFKTVCLRNPDTGDNTDFESMVTQFKTNYSMKDTFARAAVYCSGN